jgi:hypothetical protein
MGLQDMASLDAHLSGCTLLDVRVQDDQVLLDMQEPREGRRCLHCQGARLLTPHDILKRILADVAWTRRIDWADVVDGPTLMVALANGDTLSVRLTDAQFVPGAACEQELRARTAPA